METVEQIYENIKKRLRGRDVAIIAYITYSEEHGYSCYNPICLDFKNDKENLRLMKRFAASKDFYAFYDSIKGSEFYNKNIENLNGMTKAFAKAMLGAEFVE